MNHVLKLTMTVAMLVLAGTAMATPASAVQNPCDKSPRGLLDEVCGIIPMIGPGNSCSVGQDNSDPSSCSFICKDGTVEVSVTARDAGATAQGDAECSNGGHANCEAVSSCTGYDVSSSGSGSCTGDVDDDPWVNNGYSGSCFSSGSDESSGSAAQSDDTYAAFLLTEACLLQPEECIVPALMASQGANVAFVAGLGTEIYAVVCQAGACVQFIPEHTFDEDGIHFAI